MTVIADHLGPGDAARLALLHAGALPESLVSVVGGPYPRAFYRFIARSAEEALFLERDPAGLILAACVLSLHPETLNRRLATRSPLAPLAVLALARPAMRALAGRLLRPGPTAEGGDHQPPGPEVILIFTDPETRGRGAGGRLMRMAEDWLRAQGVPRIFVKTRDLPDNRALGFYAQAGYRRIGTLRGQGKDLALFDKPLGEAG